MNELEVFDIAVVGGGPAGAQAAFKAALLHRTCIWFDKGRKHSRIYYSPRVDNLPGQYGVSGRELIRRGYDTVHEYEKDYGRQYVQIHEDSDVKAIARNPSGTFSLSANTPTGPVHVQARVVILATGAVDRQPQVRDFRRRDIEAILPYANKGLADYCLLCDGHTVHGKRVAVIGCTPSVRGIAKSLKKNFGAETALVPLCNPDQIPSDATTAPDWAAVEADLAKWKIPIHFGEVKEFTGIKDGWFAIRFADGREETFDKAWISMGWYKVNNELAIQLGGAVDADGFVRTDGEGRMMGETGQVVERVYVVGDLRSESWKQIPIAWGQAEQAVVDAFVTHL